MGRLPYIFFLNPIGILTLGHGWWWSPGGVGTWAVRPSISAICAKRAISARSSPWPRAAVPTRVFGPPPSTELTTKHHHVRKFYRVRDALDHHRGGDKSAFSTRCDGGVQHQPSRLPAPRRGSPSGHVGRLDTTRPQTSHVSLAFCQLSARSRCCSRSRRASPVLHAHTCAARPPRGSEALWWRHELLCHRLSAAKGFCQRHTPPFPDRPSNQNGKATLASPARRLPETCAHRTVAYMCPASEHQQPVRFRSSISAPHTPADTPVTAHRADTPAHLISMWTCSAQRKRSQAKEKTKDAPH